MVSAKAKVACLEKHILKLTFLNGKDVSSCYSLGFFLLPRRVELT